MMLQQTQAARVVPAYVSFLRRFPTLRSLARATRQDVVIEWDGLGYSRRAVALSEAARTIARDHDGRVPSDPVALRRLPGIGPYTVAAIASISFGARVAAIDTNVRRIVARAFLGVDPDDARAGEVQDLAAAWVDPDDPGAWNQALMDLGREVCRPRPQCEACPLRPGCRFVLGGAKARPSSTRKSRFEGSNREARGAVLRALRTGEERSLEGLARDTGLSLKRVVPAVAGLARDGLVDAGPAAQGAPPPPPPPRGRVRLAG
jgi:A/G-specific adenine glycosylase